MVRDQKLLLLVVCFYHKLNNFAFIEEFCMRHGSKPEPATGNTQTSACAFGDCVNAISSYQNFWENVIRRSGQILIGIENNEACGNF